MIKHIYGFFNQITLGIVIFLVLLGTLLTHKAVVPFLAKRYLNDYNITYSSIEGRLINGITVYDLSYGDSVKVKKLQLEYLFVNLLRVKPKFSSLKIDSLSLDIDKVVLSDTNSSDDEVLPFEVEEVLLSSTKLIIDKKLYAFDANALALRYKDKLDVESLGIKLQSPYGYANLKGKVKDSKFIGDSKAYLNTKTKETYLSFLGEVPSPLYLRLKTDLETVELDTKIDSLSFKSDENLSLENINLSMKYEQNRYKFKTLYNLLYSNYKLGVEQNATVSENGSYLSSVDANILDIPFNVPIKTFQVKMQGDGDSIVCDIDAKRLAVNVLSKDYERYVINAKGDGVNLSFIKDIPQQFYDDNLSFTSQSVLSTAPFTLKGVVNTQELYTQATTEFKLDTNSSEYMSSLKFKEGTSLYTKYPLKSFSPLNLHYKQDKDEEFLSVAANKLNLIVNKNKKHIKGFGKFASTEFMIGGVVQEGNTSLEIDTKISSLEELLNQLELDDKKLKYDGEIQIKSFLKFDNQFSVINELSIPYYKINADSKDVHTIDDIFCRFSYKNKVFNIQSYKAKYKEHSIYSKKPSTISIKENGDINLDELWVYDNLLIKGLIELDKKALDIRIKSDKFTYKSKEAELSLKADLQVRVEDEKEYIEGEITALDGKIFYMPQNDYSEIDRDIIVIQEIKDKGDTNRYVNVHIDSKKPLRYKVKNIDLYFKPNVNIIQEMTEELKLYGIVQITKGEVSGGSKKFSFDKSEIYFAGELPINPQLNLNLHYYTLDYIDIEIYITNTFGSPVILFSSNPAMSQDDIISYILFGEKASTLFESSTESKKVSVGSLLSGTGLKDIFNKSAGVEVDTLNILTNQEGTLGYEIGTRFNKNIRVVYKSDTISSVILQYSLGRSTRVDVDVHETGQGVSFIYLKDF